MSARLCSCLALSLFMAAAGSAGANPYQPSVGSAPLSSADPTQSATGSPAGADAYNRAATTDPYNQPDFSAQQSFGLTAAQMLGAAAACEQLHSDRVSLSGQETAKTPQDASDSARADLDAAQQYMLDPAATAPGDLRAGEADCDRMSTAFGQLQQIQLHDQHLANKLDQPDASLPSDGDQTQ